MIDCKKAKSYMDSLLDNTLEEKDCSELINHLDKCHECKAMWDLGNEIKSNIKTFVHSVKTPSYLKNKIKNKLENKEKSFKFKPNLIAASLICLLGLGLFFNETFSSVPPLDELHNNISFKKDSFNIKEVTNQTGIKLNESFLSDFKENEYSIEGISKIKKSLTKEATIIHLKNSSGERISICFLPENYEMPKCHSVNKNGIIFHCGNKGNCNYSYWKQNNKTIAVVANSYTPDEIIEMSVPLTKKI